MSTEHLWRRYRAATLGQDENPDEIFGRTGFTNVVIYFTTAEGKRKSWVDYVLAAFLYDKVAHIAHIAEWEGHSVAQKRKFFAQLSGIAQYLTFSVVGHMRSEDEIFHSPQRLLNSTSIPGEINSKNASCRSFLLPFQGPGDIFVACGKAAGVQLELSSAASRFQLYLGNVHRALVLERIFYQYLDFVRQ